MEIHDFLDGAVAIPYQEDFISVLDELCNKYKEDEHSFAMVDEMMACFLEESDSADFQVYIDNGIRELSSISHLPQNVLRRLALYICITRIESLDDELEKSILASMVMNYLVLYKGKLKDLQLADKIIKIYGYHITTYLQQNCSTHIVDTEDLVERIVSKDFTISDMQDSDITGLKSLVEELYVYKSDQLIKNKIKGNNVYEIAYNVIEEIFQLQSVVLYGNALERLLDHISIVSKCNPKKLKNIIANIPPKVGRIIHSKSSVLLRMIQGEHINGEKDILNAMFTPQEFATYLYYELLVEKIITKEFE